MRAEISDQFNRPFRLELQQKTEWCWAAVAVSIDKFFSPSSARTQCQAVSAQFNRECRGNGQKEDCNKPSALDKLLAKFGWLKEGPIKVPPVSFEIIQGEIDAGRPVCVFIRWRDENGELPLQGRGHFIVIAGYITTPLGRQFVIVRDPLTPGDQQELDYKLLASQALGAGYEGKGAWRASFLLTSKANS